MTATSKRIIALLITIALFPPTPPVSAGQRDIGPLAILGGSVTGQSDTKSSRQETDDLLKRARKALKDGNLEQARSFAEQARSNGVKYNSLVQRLGDTPEKVLRDVEKARDGKSNVGRRLSFPFLKKQEGSKSDAFSRPNPLNSFTNTNKAEARQHLQQARTALSTGNTATAVALYEKAVAAGARFIPGEYSPQDLAVELRAAGVDMTQVASPEPKSDSVDSDPNGVGQLPPVFERTNIGGPGDGSQSQFITNPYVGANAPVVEGATLNGQGPPQSYSGAKTEALRLLATSQAALDRGDLDQAEEFARQADSLNIPDHAFGVDETQPWVMLMRINRERNLRHGEIRQTAAFATVSDLPTPRAAGETTELLSPLIPSAGLPPIQDGASPEIQMAQLVPSPDATTNRDALELFQRGEGALKTQDLETARQLFVSAWAHQDELDPTTRQRLQDHLQILRVPGSTAGSDGEDSSPQTALDQAEQERMKVLFNQVAREQSIINRQRATDPRGAWNRLTQLRERIADSQVNSQSRQRLLARIDRNIEDMEQFIAHNRARIELDERNREVLEEVERYRRQRLQTQQKLAELVDEFNGLMAQQRYPEAVIVAKQAREIDPQNPVVQNLIWKGQFARQLASSIARRDIGQEASLASFESVGDSAIPFDDRLAIEYPEVRFWSELTDRRRRLLEDSTSRYNATELEIQRSLSKPVDVTFDNQPLSYVTETLSNLAGMNIFLDLEGLKSEGVSPETAVSLPLRKPVSLRSALNLILEPLHLGYIIQDEVLRITSERQRAGDVFRRVYYVADLITPIPNFVPASNVGLAGAIMEAHRTQGAGILGGSMQTAPMAIALDGTQGEAPPDSDVYAQAGATGLPSLGNMGRSPTFGPGGLGGGPQADFDPLIELITTTIEPDSWDEVGGDGAVQPFETNLSLVVSNTQDVHEKIVDLLKQLRRLQDLQVTIEVRFITLADNFFERIGVDFDFDVDDNSGLSIADINQLDDGGPSVTVGLDPNGNFTTDLDLAFEQNHLGAAVPAFGGFDAGSAANFGFAILSDIEAFFVIQAASGDNRTNVMQAPKVTLFNGQSALVNDTAQRPFVTSVIPVVGDFAAAHQPVITVLTEGTSLSVQAVVSPDRRFVRLTLVPFFSRIGEVDTFTFNGSTTSNTGTTSVDPTDPTKSIQNESESITEGTTVQLPTFAFTSVTTTVSVPDGGTILLGGIKRLAEGRTERGLPLMSKLPYISRLFKNVGIGREAESLMMMVTPRIIIQEEEEEKLGVNIPSTSP